MTSQPPMPSPGKAPQTVDELIPVVANVIEHTRALQKDAAAAILKVDGASADLNRSAEALLIVKQDVTVSVASAVGTAFSKTLDAAGKMLADPLTEAHDQAIAAIKRLNVAADKAIADLNKASETESRKLNARAGEVAKASEKLIASKWLYVLVGALIGLALGSALTGLYFKVFSDHPADIEVPRRALQR